MSLERKLGERLSRCENCGRISLSPVIIEGHVFCSNFCYSEWLWKKKKGDAVRDHPPTGREVDD